MTMTGTEQALRYVAIGDSLSEGVGDEPWPDGSLRGWTDRLALLLADHHAPGRAVTYANLAVRGLTASRVRDTQVEVAAAMHPDVVTLTAGMNDLLRPKVDFDDLRRTLVDIVTPFTSAGARLVIVPIPDVRSVSPAGRLLDARRLRLNAIYRHLAQEHGIEPVTDTTGTVFEDRRAWAEDRLHLSPLGHERLAARAAADLGIAVGGDALAVPDGIPPARTLRTEAAWLGTHVAPWVGRRLRRASSGDGRVAKRPELGPFER